VRGQALKYQPQRLASTTRTTLLTVAKRDAPKEYGRRPLSREVTAGWPITRMQPSRASASEFAIARIADLSLC